MIWGVDLDHASSRRTSALIVSFRREADTSGLGLWKERLQSLTVPAIRITCGRREEWCRPTHPVHAQLRMCFAPPRGQGSRSSWCAGSEASGPAGPDHIAVPPAHRSMISSSCVQLDAVRYACCFALQNPNVSACEWDRERARDEM